MLRCEAEGVPLFPLPSLPAPTGVYTATYPRAARGVAGPYTATYPAALAAGPLAAGSMGGGPATGSPDHTAGTMGGSRHI